MGVPAFFKDRYNIAFAVLIVLFFLLLQFRNDAVLGWDESRHAVQGHIFYDWYKTLLDGKFVSYADFVDSYAEKGVPAGSGYNIGWFAYMDPPFHAMFQGLVFLFFGDSVWSARLATHLLILFLAPLLYLLASAVLKSRRLGLFATFLYLTCYVSFYYGRWSFLEIPISLCMVGWFYFLFYRESKSYAIKLTPKIIVHFQWSVVWSAVFLAAATMMKYQSLIFATAFIGIYIIYLFIAEWVRSKADPTKDFLGMLERSGAWSLAWRYALQMAVIFILTFWWINLALFEKGMFDRVLYEGAGRERDFGLGFFTDYLRMTLQQTRLIQPGGEHVGEGILSLIVSSAWLALIPLIAWARKGKESFLGKNDRLIIYIVVIYVTATFLISNRQLRYMIHAVPFVFMLIALGVEDISQFLERRFRVKYAFYAIAAVMLLLSVRLDIGLQDKSNEAYGRYSPELTRYLSTLDDPKFLLNIKGDVQASLTGYYYSPDLFIFESMMANRQADPVIMGQYVSYFEWQSISGEAESVIGQLSQLNSQMKTYVIAFKYDGSQYEMIGTLKELMEKEGWKATELEWYYVFEKV